MAESTDLKRWHLVDSAAGAADASGAAGTSAAPAVVVISTREGGFDAGLTEPGPPPLRLASGNYLFLYNAAEERGDRKYHVGFAILNGSNPQQVRLCGACAVPVRVRVRVRVRVLYMRAPVLRALSVRCGCVYVWMGACTCVCVCVCVFVLCERACALCVFVCAVCVCMRVLCVHVCAFCAECV
jgi:hypothetical protein